MREKKQRKDTIRYTYTHVGVQQNIRQYTRGHLDTHFPKKSRQKKKKKKRRYAPSGETAAQAVRRFPPSFARSRCFGAHASFTVPSCLFWLVFPAKSAPTPDPKRHKSSHRAWSQRSNGGFGALHLLMRHPAIFHRGAGGDRPGFGGYRRRLLYTTPSPRNLGETWKPASA